MRRCALLAVFAVALCAPAAASAATFKQVEAGLQQSCAIETSGKLDCWGDPEVEKERPEGIFADIALTSEHACAIRTDSNMVCWGLNTSGEGRAWRDGPWTDVTTGARHNCGMTPDGEVICWGDNTFGQRNPVQGQYTQVSAGAYHTCGVLTDGQVRCWGVGGPRTGTEGPGHPQNVYCEQPICETPWSLPAGQYTQVRAGYDSQCGLRTDGSLRCASLHPLPLDHPPAGRFTSVAVGTGHACAIRTNQTIVCWGDPLGGALEAPGGKFKQVSAGDANTCAVTTADGVVCWGADDYGQSTPRVGPDVKAPVLSALRARPATFRTTPRPGAKRTGTTVSFRINEFAGVSIYMRASNGKRVPGVYDNLAYHESTTDPDVSIRFAGKLFSKGRARPVKPGRYTLEIRATDRAGNASRVKKVAVRVVK
jgi:alpha-tubulin suppressor-like RCC1 family protein